MPASKMASLQTFVILIGKINAAAGYQPRVLQLAAVMGGRGNQWLQDLLHPLVRGASTVTVVEGHASFSNVSTAYFQAAFESNWQISIEYMGKFFKHVMLYEGASDLCIRGTLP